MTIGRGAGPNGLNLQVIPFRERTDFDASRMLPSSLVWLVRDIFTTHNGSWDVETQAAIKAARVSEAERREENEAVLAGPLFGIDQWARDAYLFPPNDPRFCTEGGADHDILVCVQGPDGARLQHAGVVFSSDGPAWLQPPTDLDHVVRMDTKSHGWCNLTMFSPGSLSYPPALGPWTIGKLSEVAASDLVIGPGLPWNWHVSTMIVYQATRWDALQPTGTLEEILLAEGERHQVIQLNPAASLQGCIFADGFVPNSPEFPVVKDGISYVAQRAEKLFDGQVRIYYAPLTDVNNVDFVVRPSAKVT